ncbi:sigma-70 family RNA polymerase sigma factor [Paenibacillaceae bacterium WGS1546]|uniref:sigma-70 family RNA polymerase sigma factor n=1 Tax=Cohnella sp. WGS1546 TaxID=3366810 RepID=UPI00372D3540
MQDHEFQRWLTRMIQGDSEAFHLVYESTKDEVYRLLVFLLNDKEDAGDVMSEVYLQLPRSLRGYRPEQPFRKWLNGIAARQASNWRRKLWRRTRLFDRVKAYAQSYGGWLSEERLIERERSSELLAFVNRLPYKLREVVVLRHYRDCSLEEIAETLDIPLGTVKSRHHAAIRKLRQWIVQDNVRKEAAIHAD